MLHHVDEPSGPNPVDAGEAVVVAPDKFKGTLAAVEVATHLAAGLRAADPTIKARLFPVADGGEGSVDAAVSAGFEVLHVSATNALGSPITARLARRGDTAVVEVAEVCGLLQLTPQTLAPMTSTSFGVGQVVQAALDLGARRIVLAVGGSATTDGGAGFLQALGARLEDGDGRPVPPGGAGLLHLARIDLGGIDPRLTASEFILASDVDSPLLGPRGAAATYGPQKGAGPDDVEVLERALGRLVDCCVGQVVHRVQRHGVNPRSLAGSAGAGAAGGLGFAALLIGARLCPGAEFFLDLLDFDEALVGARLVVTGEGSLDEQSLCGKAPIAVAARASTAGVRTVAVTGRCTLTPEQRLRAGLADVHSLSEMDAGCASSAALSARLLKEAGRRLAAHLRTHAAHRFSGQTVVNPIGQVTTSAPVPAPPSSL